MIGIRQDTATTEYVKKRRNYAANSLYCKSGERWPLVNEIEQVWTGVEESDRALISKLVQANLILLIMVRLLRYIVAES
jgi:hypothetical protein